MMFEMRPRRSKKEMELTYARGYTYALKYAIAWKTFKSMPLLKDSVSTRLESILKEIGTNNGFEIIDIDIFCDKVTLEVVCSPQNHIPDILKALKGLSARILLEEFPYIKEELPKGKLWEANYCVLTTGESTNQLLSNYFQSNK